MADQNTIVIKDACILIDLMVLGLMEVFFRLEPLAFTTPQVIGEITDSLQLSIVEGFIQAGKLQIDGSGQMEAIQQIFDANAALTIADSSVLELAIRKNAVIYSSDGVVRKIALANHLTVRRTLWIIEHATETGLIGNDVAIEKLRFYESVNDWSPKKEIQNLIAKLEKNNPL